MQVILLNSFADRGITAFSWMLLHSLWQGLVFAAIVSLVMLLGKKLTAAARYNFLLLVLTAFVITAGSTFLTSWRQAGSNTQLAGESVPGGTLFPWLLNVLQPVKILLSKCGLWLSSKEWLIAMIWLLAFVLRSAKMIGALVYNGRVKLQGVTPVALEWEMLLEQLRAALKIDKAVVLMESAYIKMPVVIGHIKPFILMPAGLLLSLTASQAEAILLHELAHIKRNDYLVNLLQHIVTTVFFFNPAVWWMAALVKEEREHCCDDMALSQTNNQIGLAEALIYFKQYQLYGNGLQTAFPGTKNQLLRRVSRILGVQEQPKRLFQKLLLGTSLLVVCSAAATALLLKGKQEKEIAGYIYAKENNPVTTVNILEKQPASLQQQNALPKKSTVVYYEKASSRRTTASVAVVMKATMTDQEAAVLDQKRAMEDMAKAKLDEQQAFLDQQQAMIDQRQAMLDQQKAKKDQLMFEKDRADAERAKEQSIIDRQQSLKDKKEAERRALQIQVISPRP